jgi:hypothetical protein
VKRSAKSGPVTVWPGRIREGVVVVIRASRASVSNSYRLVEQHLEELLRVWPVRFLRQHGTLRPVVERVLREFLKCGLLEHGFARLWSS